MTETEVIRIFGKPEADSHICKFTVDFPLYPGREVFCMGAKQAEGSVLLEKLFQLPAITSVWVNGNILTISKNETEEWKTLGKAIGTAVREAIVESKNQDRPLVRLVEAAPGKPPMSEEEQILRELIDRDINPMVGSHGGYVRLVKIEDRAAYLEMLGGCQGCSMAAATLREGIEKMILQSIPTIQKVIDVTDHASGDMPFYTDQKNVEAHSHAPETQNHP